MKHLKTTLVLSLIILLSANAYAQDNKHAGKGIFDKHCTQCHGINGDADTRLGHMLNKPPANFTDPEYKDSRGKRLASYTDEELENKIRYGSKGTAMPSWKATLSDEEISDVVAYVRSLQPKTVGSK